jgi:hypothetical protein
MDAGAAKEFLVAKVVGEASLSNVPLSETERKMLYFTEVHASLPDILEVNAKFERDYDADEYESKVARLLRSARARDRQSSPAHEQEWNDALDALKTEDHYILVMVDIAFGNRLKANNHRTRDFLIYVAAGIGLVLFLVLASFWRAGR